LRAAAATWPGGLFPPRVAPFRAVSSLSAHDTRAPHTPGAARHTRARSAHGTRTGAIFTVFNFYYLLAVANALRGNAIATATKATAPITMEATHVTAAGALLSAVVV
jgi:hypothetical protein